MENGVGSGSSSSSNSQACAVCRFQRRRCNSSCPLAKYFPARENQRFMSCKKLFGVSNMLRLLNQVNEKDRDDTMKSLMFEAEIRDRDPVFGCMGVISELEQQMDELKQELASAKAQLQYMQQLQEQEQNRKLPSRASNVQVDGYHHRSLVPPGSSNANSNLHYSFF